MPIAKAATADWGPKFIRSIKANIRKREKDCVLYKLKPNVLLEGAPRTLHEQRKDRP